MGTILSFLTINGVVKGTETFKRTVRKVAKGDFDAKLEFEHDGRIMSDITMEFNKMLEELRKNVYLKKDFVSNFSHEFKTPLASIKGYAEILLEDENLSKEDKEKYLKIIIDESSRLANLSNQTLTLSKLDSTSIIEELQSFSVVKSIHESILTLDYLLETKNIETEIDLKNFSFVGNVKMFELVWSNLLTNCVKYSNPNGFLQIFSTEDEETYNVHFKDNGIGIKEEHLDMIFEPYFKTDKSRSTEGVGLGLAIVKRILNIHKCDIKAYSKNRNGSEFVVTFPKLKNK